MTLHDFCDLFSARSDSFVFYVTEGERRLIVGEYCYDPQYRVLYDVTGSNEKPVPEMFDRRIVSMDLTSDYDGDMWYLVLE